MSLTSANPFRFSTIAHSDHQFLSPLSPFKAKQLLGSIGDGLDAHDVVLDAGCGKAALLRELLALCPARGVGVDINTAFLDDARREAQGLADRVQWFDCPLLAHPRDAAGYAAILCVGSVHAFGSFDACLRTSFEWLRPGGRLLVAEGYWKQPPAPAYLAAIDGTSDEFTTHADNAQRATASGYVVLRTATSNDDEWDEYEGKYCNAMMRYLAAHPDDPEAGAFGTRMQKWHAAYLQWGRATLGFGYYLLMKPA